MTEENRTMGCELDSSHLQTVPGIVTSVCFLLLEFLILFGNGLVVCAVIRVRSLHTTTNYLITSLALSDLLLAVVVLPFSSVSTLTETWSFGYAWCQIWLASDVWLCTASIYNVVAISYDRYMAVKQPLKYKLINSERMGRILVIGAWLLSFAISLPPLLILPLFSSQNHYVGPQSSGNESLLGSKCTCTPMDNNDGYIVYSALGSFFLPLAFIIVLNARIYAEVRTLGQTLKTGWLKGNASTTDALSDDAMSMRVSRGGQNSIGSTRDPKLSVGVLVNGHEKEELLRESRSSPRSMSHKNLSIQISPNFRSSPRPIGVLSLTYGKRRHSECFKSQTFEFQTKPPLPWSLNSGSRYLSGQKVGRKCGSPISQLLNTKRNCCSQTLYEEEALSTSCPNQFHPESLATDSTRVSPCSSPRRKAGLGPGVEKDKRVSASSENVTAFVYGRKMSVADRFLVLRQRSIFNRGNQLNRTEARVMRTVGVVVGCYIIFWMPFAFCYSLQAFNFCSLRDGCMPETLFNVCFWMGYTNSALNPILYALTSKEFRRGFKIVLRNPFCLNA